MTKIKICGLTNLADARWAWQCGADLLGFIFVPSSRRYIAPAEAATIARQLRAEGCGAPGGAYLVGVFANEAREAIAQAVRLCALDAVQLHGDESPAEALGLPVPVILARRVKDRVPWETLARYHPWAVLLDSYDSQRLGGSGQPWSWDLLGDAQRPERLILAGGLTPENVAQAIRRVRPWGVDVATGVESSPGCKDHARVQRFIASVREEDGHGQSTNDSHI